MPLRAASNTAGGSAAAALPPAPITDTNMNCDAPVNATSDITHVCSTLKPAATDSTPNDTAYTPVARPMESESRVSRSSTATFSRVAPEQNGKYGHAKSSYD